LQVLKTLKMKTSRYFLLFSLIIMASLLVSCTGGTSLPSSWPGLTVDASSETGYLAYQSHIYAINLANGTEKWRFPAETNNKITFYAAPALTEDGQLIAGGYDHVLYSINPVNGQQNWTFQGSRKDYHYVAAPLSVGESIFAPSADTYLYGLDLSGNLRWSFKTKDALWSLPSSDGKQLLLPSMDHHVYALSPETGNLLWTTEDLGGAIVGNPTLSEKGVLYIGTLDSEMIALDTQTGKVLWRSPAAGWVWTGPVLDQDLLYFGDLKGKVSALNAEDGAIRWQIQPDISPNGEITGTPLVVGDTLYFASKAGILYAVDKSSGNPRWNKILGGEIYASPIVSGDLILITPVKTDALLMAVDLDGNPKWSFTPVKQK
jgi:outer membrane protein assembly factor BamB